MERHQAGQEEALVEVMVETDSLNVSQRGRGSPADRCGHIKCVVALVSVIGLVMTALVAGFILYFFMFKPSGGQDCPPVNICNLTESGEGGRYDICPVGKDGPWVKIYNLTESGEQGKYDIFTVEKAATYLISGRVELSGATGEEVTLMQMWNEENMPIQTKMATETEIFFIAKVTLVNSSKMRVHFKSAYNSSKMRVHSESAYKSSTFLVYEL